MDYKLLAALAAVVEQSGFERGAQRLGISQSAISQRIKLLEARIGQPVLLRATPPTPTEVGRRLLNHVQQVRLLEHDLQEQVPTLRESEEVQRLRIAINADSLATWWGPVVADFCVRHKLLLELVVEDQGVGLKRMRAGDVAACVCAAEQPVSGARSLALGAMRYRAMASASFMQRYFAHGVDSQALASAPAIVFGPDDQLQHLYLQTLGLSASFQYHLCPSSEGFIALTKQGLGWGMLPELQISEALSQAELLELIPGFPVDVPLYWHYWRNGGELLDRLTRHLQHQVGNYLVAMGTKA